MVDLMDVLIDTPVVEQLVHEVMPRVLNGQADEQSTQNRIPVEREENVDTSKSSRCPA